MSWYVVTVERSKDDIQNVFEKLFLKHLGPRGMGLFVKEDDNYEEFTYYFTPECERHIKYYMDALKCVPCKKPEDGTCTGLVRYADEFRELIPKFNTEF